MYRLSVRPATNPFRGWRQNWDLKHYPLWCTRVKVRALCLKPRKLWPAPVVCRMAQRAQSCEVGGLLCGRRERAEACKLEGGAFLARWRVQERAMQSLVSHFYHITCPAHHILPIWPLHINIGTYLPTYVPTYVVTRSDDQR